jgi:hypothetical protein
MEEPMRRILSVVAALSAGGCVDLPAGWEDAKRVSDFTQADCDGSPYDSDVPEVAVVATEQSGAVVVSAEPLHFRCAQDVEGFWKASGGAVDLLVQPIDMNPRAVAGCDCLYRIDATIESPDAESVTVWRRWDNMNDGNEPIQAGEAAVSAP